MLSQLKSVHHIEIIPIYLYTRVRTPIHPEIDQYKVDPDLPQLMDLSAVLWIDLSALAADFNYDEYINELNYFFAGSYVAEQ